MRLLVTGASGNLGSAILEAAADSPGVSVVPASRRPPAPGWVRLDLTDGDAVERALDEARPDAVIHAAAESRPARASLDPALAMRINRDATESLARACRHRAIRLVALSTDLVFPGRPGGMYTESATPDPISAYGRSKLEGEQAALAAHPDALVVRTSLLLVRGRDLVARLIEDLGDGGPGATVFTDEWRSPVLGLDMARALFELAAGSARGILHLAGPERMSRHELGGALAGALGLDPTRIRPGSRLDAPPPPRPDDVSLDSRAAYALLKTVRIRSPGEGASCLAPGQGA